MNDAVIEEAKAAEMQNNEEGLRELYKDCFLRAKAAYMDARKAYKDARETYEYNRNSYIDVCLKGTIERISTKEKRELEELLREIVIGSEDDPIEISSDSMFDYMRLLMFGHM